MLPEAFKARMQERLGEGYPAFFASYDRPPEKGLRVDPHKLTAEAFRARAPFPLEPVPWEKNGFYCEGERLGADPYHFAGLYYLQEPSAMCAAPLLGAKKGERVLDLCAAPGGKTTQLAADMDGAGVLIANEISHDRAGILSENLERMGVSNAAAVSADSERLARQFPSFFDKILVDAPCSGEGMFKKEPNAVPEWSEENVLRCAARQRAILDAAAGMLAGGGRLVYSTCTFSEEEDEWQVEDFLRRHEEFTLLGMKKLYPHEVRGEGHFAALLERTDGPRLSQKPFPVKRNAAAERAFAAFSEDALPWTFKGEITTLADGRMYALPSDMPALPHLSVLRCGVELGTWDGKIFKPAHALCMALGTHARRRVTLSRDGARKYLRGETAEAEIPDGWCAVCVEEFPLGWGKCVRGVVKNHFPKALRLRT